MTLRFIEGFDHYANADLDKKWNTVLNMDQAMVAGRFGTEQAAVLKSGTSGGVAGTLVRAIGTNMATGVLGFAIKLTSGFPTTTGSFLALRDGANFHLALQLNTTGTLIVIDSASTNLGSSASPIAVDTWYYLEIGWTIHDSTGSCTVKLNGSPVITASGIDTRNNAGNAYVNTIVLVGPTYSGGAGRNLHLDDLYVLDNAGSVNNSYLGDVRVVPIYPSGAGNSAQWTPSAGSNYQCVDETLANGDTDYVAESTVNDIDTYAMGDIPAGAAVKGIQTNLWARKDDVGVRQIAPVIRQDGADYVGTTVTLTTSYVDYLQVYEQDPDTAAAWTAADVNALELGAKIIT